VRGVDVEHRFVEAGGVRFHVAEAGHGPPLVLLHGWPQHWWMWRDVLPALSRDHRCLALDLRGLGWSDAPSGGYDKRTLARDVLAVLDALGLDTVRLMGHDWGAFLAQLLCFDAPERIVRCVSLDVPPLWDATPDPRRLLGFLHMPLLSAPGAERAVPFLARRILGFSRLTRDAVDEYVAALSAPDRRRASVSYYRTFVLRELPGLARGAGPSSPPTVPIRLAGGARDPLVRYSRNVDLVPGAGHFLPEDDPDAVIRHAREFL
jgi:pimeloyl-ACP methyl ester carboxylesterase